MSLSDKHLRRRMQPLPGRAHRWQHPWPQPNRPTTLPCASSAALRWPSCAAGPRAWTWRPLGTATCTSTARPMPGARAANCSGCSTNCASLARAHGQPEVAALLRRDPEAIPDKGTRAPTLDEFAAQQPADYYTEAELIGLYQQQFGQTDSRSAARRRQRLRERLVQAIQWLERVGARAPTPADPVAAWLDERVARRLSVVGILKLEELVFWIRTKGFNWHRGIPKVGPEGARRIVRWLREHEGTLGALPSPALVPLSQIDTTALTPPPRIGIVPLERFRPPSERDGSQGTNRAAARCKVGRQRLRGSPGLAASASPGQPHLARLPQGGRTLPAVGGDGTAQGAFVVGRGRLRGVSGFPGCAGARVDRAAQRAALVGSVAPVRGTAGAWVPGCCDDHRAFAVRVAGAPPLPGFEPLGRRADTAGRAVDAAAAGLVAETVGSGPSLAW
ncbi:MAG: hypothetical protein IPM99_19275 [Rubrivivax sp.]|nr:hypothetical protein [Rubrivivax sp.]